MTLTTIGEQESSRVIVYGSGYTDSPTATYGILDITEIANAGRDEYGVPAAVLSLPNTSTKTSIAREMVKTSSFRPLAEEIAPELDKICMNISTARE